MLPWPLGLGGRLVQAAVSWMNVYPGFPAKEDELQQKRFYLLGLWNKRFLCSRICQVYLFLNLFFSHRVADVFSYG
jgi:hypothetical protein